MCLYGDMEMYIQGAKENIALRKKIYPDWDMRIYVAEARPDLDCETVVMGESHEHSGMFWRFLPLWEGVTIVRDTDSRFNLKEAQAVEAWLASDYVAHSMHDHDHHRCYPLFGGMFGLKAGPASGVQNLQKSVQQHMAQPQKRVADMDWLTKYLWPYIKDSTLHHSSVDLVWPNSPFPVHEEGYFVGQQHDDSGPVWR